MINENNSEYDYMSIYSGLSKLNTIFQMDVDEDDYLDNALNCLRLIGNTHYVLESFKGTTDDKGIICLPTDAFEIESVTTGNDDWFSSALKTSNLRGSGSFLNYEFYYNNPLGSKTRYLILKDYPECEIQIIYKTYQHDEEGLPLVTEKEAEACAYYYIYVKTLRESFKGNPMSANLLQLAEKNKNTKILQARSITSLNQNLVNQVGNILHSWDRKRWLRSPKGVNI